MNNLTISLQKTTLNIRVAIILKTPEGIIFEKSNEGYFFCLGGRVKENESSIEAAQRELQEELDIQIPLIMKGILENFFTHSKTGIIHEINFLYEGMLNDSIEFPSLNPENKHHGFHAIPIQDLGSYDIRPKIIKQAIQSKKEFFHEIQKSNNV